MKKLWIVAIAAPVTMLLLDAGIRANVGPQDFRARLSGAEEVPPVVTDTTGKVEIVLNEDETQAEFELEVQQGVRVTQAHIHCAPKGVNGPVVVFLAGFHNRGWDVNGAWIENATVTDANVIPPAPGPCPHVINNLRDLAHAMRQGDTYVNVHTVARPGGEVRGQLKADDQDD
ncbi:MAG TPA: CHRD domain-containing protein [Vicinamibacterales bacterium]|nr:CHRD domain-containing protein [Vicinamibacterales bacterium]